MPFSHKFVPKILFSGLFLRHFLIMNSSEYAPDSLGARGVVNPGASFFDCKGKFFATNRAPDVRTKCARFHHETAKAPEPRIKRSARPAACQRVDCGISKTSSAAKHPSASPGMTTPASRASCRSLRLLTRSTAPRIHPLETLTTTAQNPACTTSPPTPQPPQPTRTPHHRFTPVLSSSTQPQTR